ncbi:hypothetical protein SPFM6_00078 [Salmonella phage SPFM6]|nr:hypothetical protein SPFM6_00078 [Salmonella phage SPFM6]
MLIPMMYSLLFSTVMLVIGAIVVFVKRLINILYWMEKRYSHNEA